MPANRITFSEMDTDQNPLVESAFGALFLVGPFRARYDLKMPLLRFHIRFGPIRIGVDHDPSPRTPESAVNSNDVLPLGTLSSTYVPDGLTKTM